MNLNLKSIIASTLGFLAIAGYVWTASSQVATAKAQLQALKSMVVDLHALADTQDQRIDSLCMTARRLMDHDRIDGPVCADDK